MESDNLSFFTQRQHPQWAVVDVRTVVNEAIRRVNTRLEEYQSNWEFVCNDESILTYGDQNWLTMALENLMLNAVEHSPKSSALCIEIQAVNQTIELHIIDRGPGIIPGNEYRIFKPFYTTRPGATGLGLANVRTVMEKHGGGIRVGNQPDGGAIITLILQTIRRTQAA